MWNPYNVKLAELGYKQTYLGEDEKSLEECLHRLHSCADQLFAEILNNLELPNSQDNCQSYSYDQVCQNSDNHALSFVTHPIQHSADFFIMLPNTQLPQKIMQFNIENKASDQNINQGYPLFWSNTRSGIPY